MKKLSTIAAVAALAALAVCSTAAASPLKNYNPGAVGVSVGGNIPTSMYFSDYSTHGKSSSWYGDATLGLGHNTALNYRYNLYKTKDSSKVKFQQTNLMYKVLPVLSAYAGYVNTTADVDGRSKSTNSGQIGLQARVDLPLLFTVWGRAGVGNKLNTMEIGVSKPLLNNLEVDLSYYDNKFKKLSQGGSATTRGINAGLTLNF